MASVPENDPHAGLQAQAGGLQGPTSTPQQSQYNPTPNSTNYGYNEGITRGGVMLGPTPANIDQQALSANRNAQAWMGFYGTLNRPTMGALDKNQADLQARLGMLAGKYGASAGAARAGHDADVKLLDNQEAIHNIELEGARRQPGLLDNLALLTGYKYVNNRDLVEKNKGFAGTTRDIANKGATLDFDQRMLSIGQADRQAEDDAAGRGAVGSTGYQTTDREFDISRGQAGRGRDIAFERSQLGYDSSMADLNNQGIQLDLNQEMYRHSSNEDKAKAQDRIKTLELVSAQFGIKKEQLAAALSRTIADNGLAQFASANQILDMMASNDVNQKQLAANVINQAMNGMGSGITPAQLGFK